MVPFTVPEGGRRHIISQGPCLKGGAQIPRLVAVASHCQGLSVPRSPEAGGDNGCQPLRLGGALTVTGGSGQVECPRAASEHQLAGVAGRLSGPPSLSEVSVRQAHSSAHRQCCYKGAHKTPRGHQVQVPEVGGQETGALGRVTPLLLDGRAYLRGVQCAGGDWLS